jgi:hypothetical protein
MALQSASECANLKLRHWVNTDTKLHGNRSTVSEIDTDTDTSTANLPSFHSGRCVGRNSLCDVNCFLGVLAKLRKATISYVMSVRPSLLPHGTTRLTLDGFS